MQRGKQEDNRGTQSQWTPMEPHAFGFRQPANGPGEREVERIPRQRGFRRRKGVEICARRGVVAKHRSTMRTADVEAAVGTKNQPAGPASGLVAFETNTSIKAPVVPLKRRTRSVELT